MMESWKVKYVDLAPKAWIEKSWILTSLALVSATAANILVSLANLSITLLILIISISLM